MTPMQPTRPAAIPADSGPPDPYRDPFCPGCGYCLRGLTSALCPECGASVADVQAGASQIPWTRRRQIGYFRAFWRTVFQVLFHTQAFCRETARPVSYRDAVQFHLAAVAHAFTGELVATGVWMIDDWAGFVGMVTGVGVWFTVLSYAAVGLGLLAASGVHTYWFHPRQLDVAMQNRVLALSRYAAAPLAVVPLLALGAYACLRPTPRNPVMQTALQIAAAVLIGLIVWALWHPLMGFARRLLPTRLRRTVVIWIVPLVAMVTFVLIAVGIPAVMFYIAVIVDSLQP